MKEDLAEIHAYISQDNPAAADAVLEAITTAFRSIAEMPLIGRRYPNSIPELEGLRCHFVVRYRNYLIFYRIQDDKIDILYVLHTARDLAERIREQNRR